ncbi:aspartate aminotransferase, partial [Pseudomonas sp. MPR-TSA4]
PKTELLVLNGSREGLFLAAIAAARYVGPKPGKPAILMPNPFYPVYGAGAGAAACEPVYLPTTVDNGFLPDLDAIDEATLARTVAFY